MFGFRARKSNPNSNGAAEAEAKTAQPHATVGGRVMAGTVIGAHAMTHAYTQGFYVVFPEIYKSLGLVPIEAGVADAVRWLSGGFGSMVIGFLVDMYRHRRGQLLGLGMLVLAGGYFLVSIAPVYGLILVALGLAHLGAALWHPAAISLLSESFPKRRGLLISLHRSSGSVGDTVGPIAVGLLLATMTWQSTLRAGMPLAILIAILLWVLLWNLGGDKTQAARPHVNFRSQMASLGKATRSSSLIILLTVSALRGMGDRALFLFLPMYLAEDLQMSTVKVGFYMGLMNFLAIVGGPITGALSDRLGRKPMIAAVMLISAVFPPLMLASGAGIGLTISIAAFGIFLYSLNSMVQAASMDLAASLKLEGSFIGILWGNNALFGALAPIIVGALAGTYGFQVVFYFATITFVIGGILALRLSLSKGQ